MYTCNVMWCVCKRRNESLCFIRLDVLEKKLFQEDRLFVFSMEKL